MTPGGGRALPASAARAAGETRAAFTRSTVHSPRSCGPASQAGGSRRIWGQAHCCRWGAPGLWGCGAQGGTVADSHPAPDAGAVRLRSPDVAGPDLRGPESWSRHEAGGPTGPGRARLGAEPCAAGAGGGTPSSLVTRGTRCRRSVRPPAVDTVLITAVAPAPRNRVDTWHVCASIAHGHHR